MILLLLLIVILCVALSGFYSAYESALYFAGQERMAVLAGSGDRRAVLALRHMRDPGEILGVILIGNTVVLQAATYCMMYLLEAQGWALRGVPAEILSTILLFLPFFIFGEVFPKAAARLHAEDMLLRGQVLISFFRISFYPLSRPAYQVSRWLSRRSGEMALPDDFDRQKLSLAVAQAYSGGLLTSEQLSLFTQALHAGDTRVEHCMVPILRGRLVSRDAGLSQLLELHRETGFTVFPVYGERRSDIVGVIDLVQVGLRADGGASLTLGAMAQPAVFIEKGEPLSRAFRLFFERHPPLVLVREGPKILGFITREDAAVRLLR